jgi:hypothetical protein
VTTNSCTKVAGFFSPNRLVDGREADGIPVMLAQAASKRLNAPAMKREGHEVRNEVIVSDLWDRPQGLIRAGLQRVKDAPSAQPLLASRSCRENGRP